MIRRLALPLSIVLSGVFLSLAVLLPDIASAQFTGPLVPSPGEDGVYGACQLVELANNIIQFFVYLSVVAATLLFMWAGVLYVTSGPNEENISKAHKIFWNVLIGLVLVLGAWLIVDTVIRAVTDTNRDGVAPWAAVFCESTAPRTQSQRDSAGVTTTAPSSGQLAEDQLSHAEAFAALQQCGVNITSTGGSDAVRANCSGLSRCTSLQGIRQSTVDAACALNTACNNCGVTLTGGTDYGLSGVHTEQGFYTHIRGYKIDIEDTSEFNAFAEDTLLGGITPTRTSSGDLYSNITFGNFKFNVLRESNHFDFQVIPTTQVGI